jgi:hypothetical protein
MTLNTRLHEALHINLYEAFQDLLFFMSPPQDNGDGDRGMERGGLGGLRREWTSTGRVTCRFPQGMDLFEREETGGM